MVIIRQKTVFPFKGTTLPLKEMVVTSEASVVPSLKYQTFATMSKQIFIIIDPQNDFTSPEGNYAKRHPGITQIEAAKKNINKLLDLWDKERFILIKSDYRPHQFGQGLSMCIPGTFGHDIDKDLHLDEETMLIMKAEHSAFTSGQFREYIKSKEIDTLVLCGFLAEYCVKQTALDAIESGYNVVLLDDCIGIGDDVQHRKHQVMQELKEKGATVRNSGFYNLG
jgi:nicotinamidase-related amidase